MPMHDGHLGSNLIPVPSLGKKNYELANHYVLKHLRHFFIFFPESGEEKIRVLFFSSM